MGDFSRNTFDPRKHYSAVRMQQGRVQVDADWNEEHDVLAHRLQTEARDVIGASGAPADAPGFHAVVRWEDLTDEEKALPGNASPPSGQGAFDFYISAGRFYVDGLLCENERITTYLSQDRGDLPDPPTMFGNTTHLVYLDVWEREITALDDPSIREVALGGPDTATRLETVWQVKWWSNPTGAAAGCHDAAFDAALPQRDGMLSARTRPGPPDPDPCVIPPSAGYRALENQLYRVEVHRPGPADDVMATGGDNAFKVVPVASNAPNQITVFGGTWTAGEVLEVFPTGPGTDPTTGVLAQVIAVTEVAPLSTLTLNRAVPAFTEVDRPLVRVGATFKWSRDNASVVTTIEELNGHEVTVHDLGPDSVLGFASGQWVEITDDAFELNAAPAPLRQIVSVDQGSRVITLSATVQPLGTINGVNPARHPKLRRWDGIGTIKYNWPGPSGGWQDLEAGIQVRFSAGNYVTGDYWQIPARTTTTETVESGNIEWPRDAAGPVPRPPAGIEHHYAPLGLLEISSGGIDAEAAPQEQALGIVKPPPVSFTTVGDCRCVFSPLTHLPVLLYVGGDGQEAMPGFPMIKPLEVGVFNVGKGNVCTPVAGAKIRFRPFDAGQVVPIGAPFPANGFSDDIEVTTNDQGLASCKWRLYSKSNAHTTQQVEARWLDSPYQVVRFTGNLSIAAQVAYDPKDCGWLKDDTTVQKALERITSLLHLSAVAGDGQDVMPPNPILPRPLQVAVVNDCGPVVGAQVRFEASDKDARVGADREAVKSAKDSFYVATTGPSGIATCAWRLDPNGDATQQLMASLAGQPVHSPPAVSFTANLSIASQVAYDPKDCGWLKDDTTVQKALEKITSLPHLYAVAGDGQDAPPPGLILPLALQVAVTNDCGPVDKAQVQFEAEAKGALVDADHFTLKSAKKASYVATTDPLGIAKCAWQLDPDGGTSQQLKATLLDQPLSSPSFVSFTGNLGVDLTRGCAVTIRPGQDMLTIIKQLVELGRFDICLCLQPGDHTFTGDLEAVTKPKTQAGAKVHLEIGGCGRGTRLKLREAEVFRAVGLEAVTLRDLDISWELGPPTQMLPYRVYFDTCNEVTLTACHIGGPVQLGAGLWIRGAERIRLTNNVIAVTSSSTAPAVAVVIAAGDVEPYLADTYLEDNRISGIVSLYGWTDRASLTHVVMLNPKVVEEIETYLRRVGSVNLGLSGGALHVRNNRMTRITIGKDMLDHIQTFIPPDPKFPNTNGHLQLPPVYRMGCITNNVFEQGDNVLVMRHLALTSNDFDSSFNDAGFVIAESGSCVGNLAQPEVRLFSRVNDFRPAPNIILNLLNLVPT